MLILPQLTIYLIYQSLHRRSNYSPSLIFKYDQVICLVINDLPKKHRGLSWSTSYLPLYLIFSLSDLWESISISNLVTFFSSFPSIFSMFSWSLSRSRRLASSFVLGSSRAITSCRDFSSSSNFANPSLTRISLTPNHKVILVKKQNFSET